jgi:hypothetical protein
MTSSPTIAHPNRPGLPDRAEMLNELSPVGEGWRAANSAMGSGRQAIVAGVRSVPRRMPATLLSDRVRSLIEANPLAAVVLAAAFGVVVAKWMRGQ